MAFSGRIIEEVLARRVQEEERLQQERRAAEELALRRQQMADLERDRADNRRRMQAQDERQARQDSINEAEVLYGRSDPGELRPEVAQVLKKSPLHSPLITERKVIDARPIAGQSVLPSIEPQPAGEVSGRGLPPELTAALRASTQGSWPDETSPPQRKTIDARPVNRPTEIGGAVTATTDMSGPQGIDVLEATPQQARAKLKQVNLQSIMGRMKGAKGEEARRALADEAFANDTPLPAHMTAPLESEKQATEAAKLRELRTYNEMIYQKHFGQEQAALNERARLTRENKPATAFQAEAVKFYGRMKDQIEIMETWEDKLSKKDLSIINYAPNWAQVFTNPALSTAGQQYANALKVYTEARLRDDSGAAVPPGEYANDRQMIGRQIGDGPEVLQQRKRTRQITADVLAFQAGPAYEDYFGEPFVPLPVREALDKANKDAPKTPSPGGPDVPVQRKVVTIDGQSVGAISHDGGKTWKREK